MGAITTVECQIFSPGQIAFLRGVVRDSLKARCVDTSRRQAEIIARQIFDAYRSGVIERTVLLEIARACSSRLPTESSLHVLSLEDGKAAQGGKGIDQSRRERREVPASRFFRPSTSGI